MYVCSKIPPDEPTNRGESDVILFFQKLKLKPFEETKVFIYMKIHIYALQWRDEI